MFIGVIAIVIALGLAGWAAWMLGRRMPGRTFLSAWLGLPIGLIGLMLVAYSSVHIQRGFERRGWPQVEGLIVDSRVEGTRAYHPNVIYEYQIDSVIYLDSTDLHQPGFGGRARRRDVAVRTASEYVPGDKVLVRYNPSQPSESVIIVRISFSYYSMLGFGMVLAIALALVRLAPGRRRSSIGNDTPRL